MRFVYAYSIGLAACFVSVSLANRPHGGHWNILFAASLGISSTVAGLLGQQPTNTVSIVPSVALLSFVFFGGGGVSFAKLLAELGRVSPLGFACSRHVLVVRGSEHIGHLRPRFSATVLSVRWSRRLWKPCRSHRAQQKPAFFGQPHFHELPCRHIRTFYPAQASP